ncbi:hypothetical protein ACWTQY_33205, partial [Klebsiella pneumoniae]
GSGTFFSHEPTEVLPDGIPPDGQLKVAASNTTAILASSTTKNVRLGYARLFDAKQLGYDLALQEDPSEDWKPIFDRFQLVNRVEYKITYQFS